MDKSSIIDYVAVKELYNWLCLDKEREAIESAFWCSSRDIFQAKLDNLFHMIANPLLVAVCGELGNNSFDHNLGSWRDIAGVYFNYSSEMDKIIIIADRGQGVFKTLSRILVNIPDEMTAIKIAFTQIISGRSPEQRGNGLKFVSSVVSKNNWELYFQSGKGFAHLSQGQIIFNSTSKDIKGCLAVLKYR